jgi:hypothetical protein
VHALAEAMRAAAADRQRLAAMGRAARRRVREDFSWTARAAVLTTLYHRLCDGSEEAVASSPVPFARTPGASSGDGHTGALAVPPLPEAR